MTPLKPVQGYQTADGKLWEDETAARTYQDDLDFKCWCYDNICRGGEWSASMVSQEILSNWKVERK